MNPQESNHPANPAAYSVAEFCRAHRISKVLFYQLLKEGTGPRIMKVGRRTLVSTESAADWRCQTENRTVAGGGAS